MEKQRPNPPFLNGIAELLILQLLSRQAMHGYQLVQAIKVATDHAFGFGEGCIYPLLHRLEAQKVLTASTQTVGKRTRVVYRVTPKGKKQLDQQTATWRRVVAAVSQVLQGEVEPEPGLA